MATPRQSCHSTVFTVGLSAEVGVDIGDEVVEQDWIERVAVGIHRLALSEGGLDVATLHHHNHRDGLAAGNGVVHDVLHVALLRPSCLVLAHAMLQVEHGVALLGVLLRLILCGSVNHGVAPFLLFLAVIVDAAHLSGGHSLLRTVVVALGSLGNLDTASLAVAAEEGLGGRVDEVHTANVHEIVVETNHQGISHSSPTSLTV